MDPNNDTVNLDEPWLQELLMEGDYELDSKINSMEQFESLEADNLFLINQKQESDQVLEKLKHELEIKRAHYKQEISKLEANLDEVRKKKKASEEEEMKLLPGRLAKKGKKKIPPQIRGLIYLVNRRPIVYETAGYTHSRTVEGCCYAKPCCGRYKSKHWNRQQ